MITSFMQKFILFFLAALFVTYLTYDDDKIQKKLQQRYEHAQNPSTEQD